MPRKKKAPEPEPPPALEPAPLEPATAPLARRFQDEFPNLRRLNLEVTQNTSCYVFSESSLTNVRVPCSNRLCTGGGIEPLAVVAEAVAEHETAHKVTIECPGSMEASRCARPFVIRVQAVYGSARG